LEPKCRKRKAVGAEAFHSAADPRRPETKAVKTDIVGANQSVGRPDPRNLVTFTVFW
jgi:hypothetical protein